MTRPKHTSVARILELLQCKKKYHGKVTRPRELRDERTRRGVTGQATHMLAAGASPAEAKQFIETTLHDRSIATRRRVYNEAMVLADRAKKSRHAESTGERLERQFVFRGFKGWEVFAEPDEAHFYWRPILGPDGEPLKPNNRGNHRERVLRIGDCKVTPQVMDWHWTQVYMFTYIATEIYRWRGPTEMLIYPLKQGWIDPKARAPLGSAEATRTPGIGHNSMHADGNWGDNPSGPVEPARLWWTPELAEETKHRMLGAIVELERSWKANDFPPKAGGHCFGCIQRYECEVGKAFMEKRLAEHAAAAGVANAEEATAETEAPPSGE